jgi:hypothetical protein
MAMIMRVYLSPDSDLRAFAGAPRTLQMWLRYPHSPPAMALGEGWRDLDAILRDDASGQQASPLAPAGADYTYPFAADHGAHGLSSPSAERLLQAIDAVTRERVEGYVQRRQGGRRRPSRPPTPAEVAARTDELLAGMAQLRERCALAVTKRYGLVMALWEEKPPGGA